MSVVGLEIEIKAPDINWGESREEDYLKVEGQNYQILERSVKDCKLVKKEGRCWHGQRQMV